MTKLEKKLKLATLGTRAARVHNIYTQTGGRSYVSNRKKGVDLRDGRVSPDSRSDRTHPTGTTS